MDGWIDKWIVYPVYGWVDSIDIYYVYLYIEIVGLMSGWRDSEMHG